MSWQGTMALLRAEEERILLRAPQAYQDGYRAGAQARKRREPLQHAYFGEYGDGFEDGWHSEL